MSSFPSLATRATGFVGFVTNEPNVGPHRRPDRKFVVGAWGRRWLVKLWSKATVEESRNTADGRAVAHAGTSSSSVVSP